MPGRQTRVHACDACHKRWFLVYSGGLEDDRQSRMSSGSERESAPPPAEQPDGDDAEEDHETKGLVLQQDSFDDELPYVPTTLPMER